MSKLHVGPERGDENRAAIAIVAGIVDMLEARSDIETAPHVRGVINLKNVNRKAIRSIQSGIL